MHRRRGTEVKLFTYLSDAGRIPLAMNMAFEILIDFPLPLGEMHSFPLFTCVPMLGEN